MIHDNLTQIRATMEQAAKRVNRNPETIRLVAVSKLVAPERIQQAVDGGQLLFGENYLQEAAEKIPKIRGDVRWHFIGHLQSNKAKQVTTLFDMVETVDRLKVALALDHQAKQLHKRLEILVQVNTGREPQKSGVLPEETEQLLRAIRMETDLPVRGLMTMPPFSEDPEAGRSCFRTLRELAQHLATQRLFWDTDHIELSMGMSADYPVAIEEGATMIRVGTALFGDRKKPTCLEQPRSGTGQH